MSETCNVDPLERDFSFRGGEGRPEKLWNYFSRVRNTPELSHHFKRERDECEALYDSSRRSRTHEELVEEHRQHRQRQIESSQYSLQQRDYHPKVNVESGKILPGKDGVRPQTWCIGRTGKFSLHRNAGFYTVYSFTYESRRVTKWDESRGWWQRVPAEWTEWETKTRESFRENEVVESIWKMDKNGYSSNEEIRNVQVTSREEAWFETSVDDRVFDKLADVVVLP